MNSSARAGSAYGLRIKLTSNVDDFIKKEVREQFWEIRQCLRTENQVDV